jgi:hypothetical protein
MSAATAWLRAHRSTLLVGATAAGVLLWLAYAIWGPPEARDARAYFLASGSDLYTKPPGADDAYLYSPAFAQALEPLRWLGWEGFRTAIRAVDIGALAFFTGPLAGPLLFVAVVPLDIRGGNIHLLLALAMVAGFRWPATWAFVLLTKVTPGVGLLWFAVRREWPKLAIALGVTAVIAAISFVYAPSLWFDWFRLLASTDRDPTVSELISLPIWIRLAVAAAIVVWGAATDRRWTVILAGYLALPITWLSAVTMFAAVPMLATRRTWFEQPREQGEG